jgi:hypothetical protein
VEDLRAEAKLARAVINCNLPFVFYFLTEESNLYATYYKQITAGTRTPATPPHDRERHVVDAMLYGHYADEIRFAALSLDGRGLMSYGPVSIVLKEVAIATRSTVLEENSFTYVRRHNLTAGTTPPLGYMAIWDQRDLLAVAKIEPLVKASTPRSAFGQLVLKSVAGKPRDDEFMEVHIWGTFDVRAVDRILAPRRGRGQDRRLIPIVREAAARNGIAWEEF